MNRESEHAEPSTRLEPLAGSASVCRSWTTTSWCGKACGAYSTRILMWSCWGEAGDGIEALALVERLYPSVVVMDINMPKMNGIEATVRIKAQHPDIVVLGLSVNAGDENQEAMIKAGAVGLLTKEAAVDELYQAIHTAVYGDPHMMRALS